MIGSVYGRETARGETAADITGGGVEALALVTAFRRPRRHQSTPYV